MKTMTHENQALHVELHKLGEEKEALRVKVEEYASRVAQYEDTLAVKVQHIFIDAKFIIHMLFFPSSRVGTREG